MDSCRSRALMLTWLIRRLMAASNRCVGFASRSRHEDRMPDVWSSGGQQPQQPRRRVEDAERGGEDDEAGEQAAAHQDSLVICVITYQPAKKPWNGPSNIDT